MKYRILGLDLDGTLLDPEGALRRSAREAVGAARKAGIAVVPCTGRRFRTALPLVRELSIEGHVVVNNGAVVKDVNSARTVHQSYLSSEVFPEVLDLTREHGPPLVYVDTYHEDTDILTDRSADIHPFQAEYLSDHGEHVRWVEDLAATRRDDVIMVSCMSEEKQLFALRERAQHALGSRIETHLILNKNYRGHILEFFSPLSGKWSALRRVAAEAGVAESEIAAIGDDANDADMLRGAGLGIAMGNAVAEARSAADRIVASNAEDGVVEAIEQVMREA